jgi:hypothetical protein
MEMRRPAGRLVAVARLTVSRRRLGRADHRCDLGKMESGGWSEEKEWCGGKVPRFPSFVLYMI